MSCRSSAGLEVTTSSTALQALTDAVLYLVAYPFECAEQLSSRVLAVAALRDVLTAFRAEGLPKPDEIEAAVKRDIDRLRALQDDDGGFGFWRRGERLLAVRLHPRGPRPRPREGEGLPRARRDPRALAALPARDRPAHPVRVREGRAPRAPGLRALRAGSPGRRRPRRERGPSFARPASRGCRSRRSAGSCPSSRRTRGLRPRWRPSVAASPTTSPRPRAPRTSSSPTATARTCCSTPTGAPTRSCSRRSSPTQPRSDLIPKLVEGLLAHRTGRPLGEHAGERLRPPRPRPLLPGLREDDPRLRGPRLARRSLRGLPRVPGPHDRAEPPRDPDAVPPGRDGHERPPARQGGPGAALLPDRPALRAGQPRPRAARPRVHRRALLRGCRRPEGRAARRRRHLAHPRRRPRARAAHDGRARRGGTTSRSSTRCRRASSR